MPVLASPSLPTCAFDQLPEASVLSAPPEPVRTAQAASLLDTLYGLRAELKPLSGERDANFLVSPEGSQARMVLKISHPVEPAAIADIQTQALQHLAAHAPGLPVQRLQASRSGQLSRVTDTIGGKPRVVRLLSYLEGLPMPQAEPSPRQQASVASTLARLDQALAGLARPAAAGTRMPWDIQRADSVASLIGLLPEPGQRVLVEHALERFALHVRPQLGGLRQQAIHNDFNIFNLLVDPLQPDQVCGILDFGDMVWAPLINDVAVAASYQVGRDTSQPQQALDGIAAFARAYHAIHPLQPQELALLLDLIRARLAMVVCISGWRAARQPANADYVLRNNAVSWARLATCSTLTPEQLLEALAA